MPKPVTIEELSQYVRYVEVHFRGDPFLFRGQSRNEPLVPKIGRISLTMALLKAEQKFLTEFKRQSISSLDYEPSSAWDWLALMQHHKLATRLLDWTLNPLAALWFAVSKPPRDDHHGVVWAFKPNDADLIVPTSGVSPFKIKRTRVFQPRHITKRIVAQSGCFTVHRYMVSQKRFVPLERNKAYRRLLTKFIIPSRLFADLRYQLDRFGVNSASLFPELEGLAKHIQWMYSLHSDEEDKKTEKHSWVE